MGFKRRGTVLTKALISCAWDHYHIAVTALVFAYAKRKFFSRCGSYGDLLMLSLPVSTKFYLIRHWGGGKAALHKFQVDWITTLVSMVTDGLE